MTEVETLVSGYYAVDYTYDRSIFEKVSTHVAAYSAEDAAERVLLSISANEGAKVLDARLLFGGSEPVTCTYNGGEGAVYPEGPWVAMEIDDIFTMVVVCDVHGYPAHGSVYSTDPECLGRYSGPCSFHPPLIEELRR